MAFKSDLYHGPSFYCHAGGVCYGDVCIIPVLVQDTNPARLKAQTISVPDGDELGDYAHARGFEILDTLCSAKKRVQMSEATLTAKAYMAFLQEMADHGHQLNAVMYFSMISGLTKAYSAWYSDSMSRRATRRHGIDQQLEDKLHFKRWGMSADCHVGPR
jgi:hypothetical protein